MTDPPRIGPRSVVEVVGPDVRYVVVGLETNGPDAVLRLRTEDGLNWSADRPTVRYVPEEPDRV